MILATLIIMMLFVRVAIIELSHDGRDALVLVVPLEPISYRKKDTRNVDDNDNVCTCHDY